MLDTGILTQDLGTILVGEDAVREGLINEVGEGSAMHCGGCIRHKIAARKAE